MAGIPEYTLRQIEHVRRLPEVNWVSDVDLPAIFTVKEAPGVFFINVLKWFDPTTGILLPSITPEEGDGGIPSNPANGDKRIVNLTVVDGKLKVDYDDGNP